MGYPFDKLRAGLVRVVIKKMGGPLTPRIKINYCLIKKAFSRVLCCVVYLWDEQLSVSLSIEGDIAEVDGAFGIEGIFITG